MCAMPSITQVTGLLEIITMQLQKLWKNHLFVKLKMGMVAVASDWPELNPLTLIAPLVKNFEFGIFREDTLVSTSHTHKLNEVTSQSYFSSKICDHLPG